MPKISKRFKKEKSSYPLNSNKIVIEHHTVKISFKTVQILNSGKILNRKGQLFKKMFNNKSKESHKNIPVRFFMHKTLDENSACQLTPHSNSKFVCIPVYIGIAKIAQIYL